MSAEEDFEVDLIGANYVLTSTPSPSIPSSRRVVQAGITITLQKVQLQIAKTCIDVGPVQNLSFQ